MSRDVSMLTAIRVNRTRLAEADFVGHRFKIKETDPQRGGLSVCKLARFELRRARVFGGFRENPATI